MKKINRYILLLSISFYSIIGNTQSYKKGILPGVDSTYKSIPVKAKLTRSFYDGAPSYYSLKKYAPIPASQGQYGTCTGWAVAYAARTIIEAQLEGWTDKQTITSNAFSPTFQYRQGSNKSNCNGAYTSEIVKSLKTIGSVPKKEFYVNYGTQLCPSTPVDDPSRPFKLFAC